MTDGAFAGAGRYDYAVVDVVRVLDGDTYDLRIDLGYNVTVVHRYRLVGVDTPDGSREVERPARDYAAAWLAELAGYVRVRSYKPKDPTPDGSFGRWIADVYADPLTGERRILARELVDAGLAVESHRR